MKILLIICIPANSYKNNKEKFFLNKQYTCINIE